MFPKRWLLIRGGRQSRYAYHFFAAAYLYCLSLLMGFTVGAFLGVGFTSFYGFPPWLLVTALIYGALLWDLDRIGCAVFANTVRSHNRVLITDKQARELAGDWGSFVLPKCQNLNPSGQNFDAMAYREELYGNNPVYDRDEVLRVIDQMNQESDATEDARNRPKRSSSRKRSSVGYSPTRASQR
jgi:hypothetical protein